MDPRIHEYIREHRATYTRDAIRAQLIAAGHDPAAVDAALQELDATDAAPGQEGLRTFRRWAVWLHLGALVAVFLLLVVLKGSTALGIASLAAAVLAVALLIGWAVSSFLGRILLPRAGLTVALVLPAISAIALGGSCFALMYGSIQAPPRDGTVHLQILAPRTFDGRGAAACYVGDGYVGVQVNSQELGTLDGKQVSAYLSWSGNDSGAPKPAEYTDLSILLAPPSDAELPESYTPIFSTRLEVEAAPDLLSGTVHFEGLVAEPMEDPGGPVPEPISGSLSWICE